MRLWAALSVLGVASCGSCDSDPPITPTEEAPPVDTIELPGPPDFRMVFLTDLKGYLEPCGCTANMLGGIDRMAFRLRQLQDEATTEFVAVGDLFFDDATHGGPSSPQVDQWRTETLTRILGSSALRVATPGALDYARAEELLALSEQFSGALVASGWTLGDETLPPSFTIEHPELSIRVVGISDGHPDANEAPAREAIDSDESDFVLLLVRGNRRDARRLTELDADFLVLGGIDREDPAPPSERNGTWTFHGGRQGQGLLVIDLWRPREQGPWQNASQWTLDAERTRLDAEIEDLAAQLERWRAEGTHEASDLQRQSQRLDTLTAQRRAAVATPFPESGRVFAARWEPLQATTAEQSPEARQILEELDVRINDHNREAFADRAPPPAEEGSAHYVGSQRCASCHAPAFDWWREHEHGRAYATLEERNKQFHLDCVGCHVTGYERPGGSTVTHLSDGALQNVGCEVCHGAGSAHVESPSTDNIARETEERLCIACHNEEHSELFQYDAYRATLLVPGHGRPAE